MNENDLKSGLTNVMERLKELGAAARKLRNQNYADIAASAHGRVKQLIDHPDLPLVHKEMAGAEGNPLPFDPNPPATAAEAIERMRADGDADPEGTAKLNWPLLFPPAGN